MHQFGWAPPVMHRDAPTACTRSTPTSMIIGGSYDEPGGPACLPPNSMIIGGSYGFLFFIFSLPAKYIILKIAGKVQVEKRVILYPGYCITHHHLSAEQVIKAKQARPDAVVLVHPECTAEVIAQADAALSTSQMSRYVEQSPAKTFLIGTEEGLLHRLKKDNPDKNFYVISPSLICPNMKKTTPEILAETMETRRNVVTVPEEIRVKAKLALDRMLAVV